jgi:hypothetical protein
MIVVYIVIVAGCNPKDKQICLVILKEKAITYYKLVCHTARVPQGTPNFTSSVVILLE